VWLLILSSAGLAAVAPWFPPTFTSSGTSSTRAFSRVPLSVASPMATDIRCGVGTHQPVGAAMRALRLLQPIDIGHAWALERSLCGRFLEGGPT
jgi:hypothetical protein